jgi:hypothetical protein
MDAGQRRALIERYKDGYRAVTDALGALAEHELDLRPAPGDWSPREIVHHIADSEMTSAIRVRRLLAEDHPQIAGYDEAEFARRLHYDRPIETSLEALRAARRSTAALLETLTDAEWAREGTHSESGRYTMDDWLSIYAAHAHDHAAQILRAHEAASGKGAG